MVSRKYIKDYKLSETVTDRGRIKTESVYVGGEYYLTASNAAIGSCRRLFVVCAVLAWCGFVAALIPASRGSHLIYVALPHAFSVLPLFLMSEFIWYMRAGRGPYTHERADKVSKELAVCAAFTAGLAAVSLIGLLIALIIAPEKMLPGDIVFAVSDAAVTACGLIVFTRRNMLYAKKSG